MTILNNKNIENNSTHNSDICIIGSGMSAQILASKFKNKKIIMIESGKINYDKEIQELNAIDQKGIPFRKNFTNRVRQLGGSANLWANQLMFLKESNIKNRDWVTKDFSWPLTYEELKIYYDEVIQIIYKENFENFDYFNKIDQNEKNFFLENIFSENKTFEFNNSFWPSKIEKFNFNSSFTKKILNSKMIHFFESFTATETEINEDTKSIKSIKVKSINKSCTINSNLFILACGAIENARFLLNNQKNNKLLENSNIGKYFMDHPRTNLGVLKSNKKIPLSPFFGIKYNNYDFRKTISLSEKYQGEKKILNAHAYIDPKFKKEDEDFFINFLSEIKKLIKFKGFPNISYKNLNIKKIFELVYLTLPPQISNSFLNNILRIIFKRKNYYLSFNEMNINYQSEQLPHADSKIYLSNNKDCFNQNTVIIDWKLNDMDKKTENEFIKTLSQNYTSHDLLTFYENNNKEITDSSHHSGTTRMSLNKSDGVVDKNCKVHGVRNLYVAGSSVFRSAGSVNPGLTNMAMSIRLAKYIEKLA
tara:strand:- start:6030 stop:7631 length:1602 start_codon:yes stop_codon:yes gene_type:complete